MAVNATLTGKEQSPEDLAEQAALKARGALPAHLAIIMDGNGRWAQQHGHGRIAGHRNGVTSVRDVTEASAQLGVSVLTLYTFSTENWSRPRSEVRALMELLIRSLHQETKTLMQNDIRLTAVGDLTMLPASCRRELNDSMSRTRSNRHMTLNLALSYSGRWDILTAVRALARDVQAGQLAPDDIDESVFASRLSTQGIPDPDLLIRTSGEFRISNFLLWQLAYTELYFADVMWPDFRRKHLYQAIRSFQDRDRRFGRLKA